MVSLLSPPRLLSVGEAFPGRIPGIAVQFIVQKVQDALRKSIRGCVLESGRLVLCGKLIPRIVDIRGLLISGEAKRIFLDAWVAGAKGRRWGTDHGFRAATGPKLPRFGTTAFNQDATFGYCFQTKTKA